MDPMIGILCGAIAGLWAYVVYSGRRCEQRNDELSKEIKQTKDGVISRAEEREREARGQAVIVARALERQTEISAESVEVMRDIKELTYRTVRALRRYAGEKTPGDGSKGDDSETSRFFQAGDTDPLEPRNT